MTRTIELSIVGVALLIGALAVHSWLNARADQRRLQSTLAAQKQLIDAAGAREAARDATLQQTLAQIDALKRATQTPAEILRELPKYLALPAPILLATPNAGAPSATGHVVEPPDDARKGIESPSNALSAGPASSSAPASSPASDGEPISLNNSGSPHDLPSSPTAVAEIPAADLKPLYDYVQDCRACQARLAAATQNASDDETQIAALTRQRDAAITASKGGGFWLRFRRSALWLAVGAGLGYAAHH